MTTKLSNKPPLEKTMGLRKQMVNTCLKRYEQEKSLWSVYQFICEISLEGAYYEDCFDYLIPEIRKRYFPDMTIDSLLEESLAMYRSEPVSFIALIKIWRKIYRETPLADGEYQDFVLRFEELLKNEPNRPSQDDWSYLSKLMMKYRRYHSQAKELFPVDWNIIMGV